MKYRQPLLTVRFCNKDMGYLHRKMMEDESLIYVGKLHWILFLKPLIMLVSLIVIIGVVEQEKLYRLAPFVIPYKALIYQLVLLLFVGIPFLRILIHKLTTTIGVSNQRVLFKTGFIAINLQGMPLTKVENVNCKFSIIGRFLGYGTLIIKGSGSTPIIIYYLAKPMQLRDELAAQLNN